MYTERDEINFHGLLRNTREYRNVTLEKLSFGICAVSNLHYYEIGERVPDYLTRNRLMGRLGLSSEEFEDYVYDNEYKLFTKITVLKNALYNKNIEVAEKCIGIIRLQVSEDQKVLNQLLFVAEANLKRIREEKIDDIIQSYKLAIQTTLDGIELFNIKEYILSKEEVGIVEKYIYYKCKKAKDEGVKDLSKYKLIYIDIMKYIENSCWDSVLKIKVLSGCVVRFASLFGENLSDKERNYLFKSQLELAIRLERETGRVYYIEDLFQIKKEMFSISKEEEKWRQAVINTKKLCSFENSIEEQMDMILFDFSTLYNISEIISLRRKMLGMTRQQLACGICSIKTLDRLEKGKVNCQQYIVNQLFERLHISCVYRRFEIITDNPKVNELYKNYKKAINDEDFYVAKDYRDELLKKIEKDIHENTQILARITNVCNKNNNLITNKEFAQNIERTLEQTVKIKQVTEIPNIFLNKTEKHLIYYLAAEGNKDMRKVINDIYETSKKRLITSGEVGLYSMMFEWLASSYGNEGLYVKSDEIAKNVAMILLKEGRISLMPHIIYNLVWNKVKQNLQETIFVDNGIELCKDLSIFCYSNNMAKFFNDNKAKLIVN